MVRIAKQQSLALSVMAASLTLLPGIAAAVEKAQTSGTVYVTGTRLADSDLSFTGVGGVLFDYSSGTPDVGPSGGSGNYSPNNTAPTTDPKKDKSGCANRAGDPVIPGSGSKIETFSLFKLPGEMGLRYVMYYNSSSHPQWSNNFDYRMDTTCSVYQYKDPSQCHQTILYRPDGSSITFNGGPTESSYTEIGGDGLVVLTRDATTGNYTLRDEDTTTQVYSAAGQIQSITDVSGIGWTFSYTDGMARITHTNGQSMTIASTPLAQGQPKWPTVSGLVVTVTDPAGNAYTIKYGDLSRANSAYAYSNDVLWVSLPGNPATTISFKYQEAYDWLTEVDYNGAPYAYTTYDAAGDAYFGRATGTVYADGSGKTTINYGVDSAGHLVASITNPMGHVTTNTYGGINNQLSAVSDAAVATCGASSRSRTYDANGNLAQAMDANGNVHTYNYAANGQLQTETEAAGTSLARTTDYVWDPDIHLNRLLSATVQGVKKTAYTYNAQNRLASISITNLSSAGVANQTRTISYQYVLYGNGMVQTLKVTKPSPTGSTTDTYQYDANGNLTSITNGLGHTTTYTGYNGLGLVGTITGPNGDKRSYVYDERGRVKDEQSFRNGGVQHTTYEYDSFGRVAKVTQPDGQYHGYQYDVAGHLMSEYEPEPGGTYAQQVYSYNAMALPTSVKKQRVFVEPKQGTVQ